jgi:hypothetical protein
VSAEPQVGDIVVYVGNLNTPSTWRYRREYQVQFLVVEERDGFLTMRATGRSDDWFVAARRDVVDLRVARRASCTEDPS